ncbi:MAG: Fe-Mn family superoxide dismutase [Mariprofundales bacterium]
MIHILPKLQFSLDALEPHISQETLEYHYGKHHNAYVNNLNKQIIDTNFVSMTLEEIILSATGGIFNNAAQVWNHSFYWQCLSPQSSKQPTAELAKVIITTFGSFHKFKEEFTNKAATHFGSGWVWLVQDITGKLTLEATSNAANPMTTGKTPLLTCDVWEHAYYIDYRNARPKYIASFWELVNWDFVASNFTK